MNGRNVRLFLFFTAIAIVIILAIFTGEKYHMDVPAVFPLGAIGLGMWGMIEISIPIMRGMTTRVICNAGHYSIRPDDVKHVPWHSEFMGKDKKGNPEKKGLTVNMSLMFTGSMHINNFFTAEGRPNDPVLIFPSIYEQKEENNYHCYANLYPCEIEELPLSLQQILYMFPRRVDRTTPILYGLTSHIDGSSTTTNLDLQEKLKTSEANNAVLIKALEQLRKEIAKDRELEKKEYITLNAPFQSK